MRTKLSGQEMEKSVYFLSKKAEAIVPRWPHDGKPKSNWKTINRALLLHNYSFLSFHNKATLKEGESLQEGRKEVALGWKMYRSRHYSMQDAWQVMKLLAGGLHQVDSHGQVVEGELDMVELN
ncbi:hypothetical protein L195_g038650 [Trifolium pratense]|uniref:Uncharacterized protein n=1 Tax=Trifolium pratense TaxID=57577 RepID=A0A2K3LVQ7_TRIPR|nr:hypothetical protein L195_g038650 [Trifolium pratense]